MSHINYVFAEKDRQKLSTEVFGRHSSYILECVLMYVHGHGVWVVAVRNKPKENTFALKKKNEHQFLILSSGFN